MNKKVTKFKCPVCDKITSGRMPKDGDASFRYPRRHKDKSGKSCVGNTLGAIWIDIEIKPNSKFFF